MESHHSDLITGLRNLADFLENNDGAEMSRWQRVALRLYPEDAPEMAVTAKSLGGRWNKEVTDYAFSLTQNFSPQDDQVYITMELPRDSVCKPRVVGTQTVTKTDPTYRYPSPPTVEVEEDILEWDCPKSLLKYEDAS